MTSKKRDDSGLDLGVSTIAAIAACVVPGAGPALELAHKLTTHLRSRAEAKEAQRIREYSQALLSGLANIGSETTLPPDAADADFEAILSALLNDIEDEKTIYYARLTKTLATGMLDKSYIRPMILALKDISIHEIETLRTSYIAQKHALIPAQGPMFSSEITPVDPNDPNHYGYRAMEQRGLIHESKLTNYGVRFMEAICPLELRTPDSIGMKRWLTTCLFVTYEMGNDHLVRQLETLARTLRENQVKVLPFCALTRENAISPPLPHAFVFFGPNWKNSIEYRAHLRSNLRNVRTVVVLLPGADDDSLKGLDPADVIRGQSLDDIPALTDAVIQALIKGAPRSRAPEFKN